MDRRQMPQGKKPRSEPEIIPPDHAERRTAQGRPQTRVFIDAHGTERVYVATDARLLDSKDLHVRESALTGESLPVDKAAADLPAGQHGMADAGNSVFLGTAVQTGIGTAVIVRTGKDTAFGVIAQRLAMRPPETEFARGIRHFGLM